MVSRRSLRRLSAHTRPHPPPPSTLHQILQPLVRLLLDLREDLRVAEEEVLLHNTSHINLLRPDEGSPDMQRTSSPTLIELPPQPGRRTRSPAFTFVGTTLPSLSGAPGPVAMTVASGSGLLVADAGRKTPDAVFYTHIKPNMSPPARQRRRKPRTVSGLNLWTRTRSRRGTTALMDLNVAWAACTLR